MHSLQLVKLYNKMTMSRRLDPYSDVCVAEQQMDDI